MKSEDRFLQISAAIAAALLLVQLLSCRLPQKLLEYISRPQVTTAMLFVQTGRVFSVPQVTQPEITEPTATEAAVLQPVIFLEEDAALVQIRNASGKKIDVAAMLQTPLSWQREENKPLVLILHTHCSEAYADCVNREIPYRSLDETENMLAIGDRLTRQLEQAGIGVIHDRTIHDQASYNGAYNHSRKQTEIYLEQYPSIALVLDLHRDAMADQNGKQLSTCVNINGTDTAQLMLVMGTNAGGLYHPQWQENMALAVKLHALLAKVEPNLIRPISLRSQRFNQDLSPGAMLVEVGTAGNSQAQAMAATDQLATALISLICGVPG